MTEQNIATVWNTSDNFSPEMSKFLVKSTKKQLQTIPQLISMGEASWKVLMTFLLLSEMTTPNIVVGKVYQALYQVNVPKIQEFLQIHFPCGVVALESECNIDYQLLKDLLINQKFKDADTVTRQKLCELAGEASVKRKWVYFTEVEQFPATDLHTINSLWWVYSEGRFGFSVQRKLWLSVGKDFTKLWPKIGWKKENNWTFYPNEFTWDLSAPVGHLPLLNQLRGVRVTASLFTHPVWAKNNW
ncbi:GUN4 domain-containing protein [cyanobacterium endosymbiont of Epithemia clementina EcSB]|uniref:GUN4 domain-containing protein n=1 Tax=cyanobacterium endosymbiont of Epithemia clementina EcSB TaxID=3034674 RepID=UPI0024802B78|nr:GUN4 domain-containing protein [cyanobacterium endosymbiont of Epithemia clementina EcSB]WGT67230.1 GUN4 N-terminal ARM-like repeat domain-containing protein [cyanobacterium endosymbiont of Epithemia clementina EcSB]